MEGFSSRRLERNLADGVNADVKIVDVTRLTMNIRIDFMMKALFFDLMDEKSALESFPVVQMEE